MSQLGRTTSIPQQVRVKLGSVRRRMRMLAAVKGLMIAVTVGLGAMMAAMLVDRCAVLFDSRWRCVLTFSSLSLAWAAMILWCLRPLFRRRRLPTVAEEIDRAVPLLQERWTTVAELAANTDPPAIRGSEPLIREVANQAADMSSLVVAPEVEPVGQLRRWGLCLVGAATVLVLVLAVGSEDAGVLLKRFWAPRSDITLTRVVALTGSRYVPKGEPVTIEARLEGRRPDSAKLFIRPQGDRERSTTVSASPDSAMLQFAVASVKESFQYRIRAGDDRTDWFTVEAVERPTIAEIRFCVTPPAYSKLPVVRKPALPGRCRALAGSRLEIEFRATKPLDRMELRFGEDRRQSLTTEDGQWYRYATTLSESIAFTAEMIDTHGLKNMKPPRCRVQVYPDEPPAVDIVSPDEHIVVPPDETIPVEFEARDDFGITGAELQVTVEEPETPLKTLTIPIPLDDQPDPTNVRRQIDLDLAELKAGHGAEVSYVIQVTDTKLATSADAGSMGGPAQQQEPDDSLAQTGDDARTPDGSQDDSLQNDSPQGDNPQNDGRQDDPSSPGNAIGADTAGPTPPSEGDARPTEPSGGSPRPPDDMTRRQMPGQSSARSSRHSIEVDEWAGTFEGQNREKLQIAIEHYIEQLTASLLAARKPADELAGHVRSGLQWGQTQTAGLGRALAHLREADGTIEALTNVSRNTPYAFMGMQLEDIGESHVAPAQKSLDQAGDLMAQVGRQLKELKLAVFHIDQALAKLAGLTRQYETAKKAQELGESMERVAKMHQIFIQDMFALLKSSRPTLNPRTGQMIEVDEEFAEKLRENLEKFKELLAELAKVLAEDPELLRRFMAMGRLDARTLRDQATLLAGRQGGLHEEVCEWMDAPPDTLPAVQAKRATEQILEQLELAEAAAKLHDNMVTWLPRGTDASQGALAECRQLSADIALAAREVRAETSAGRVDRGVELAETLVGRLGELDGWLSEAASPDQESPKLDAYLANRMMETNELMDRQAGWAKKVTAIRAGRYGPAGRVDQYRLMADTLVLGGKLEGAEAALSAISDEIAEKARELVTIIDVDISDRQAAAVGAFQRDDLAAARSAEGEAVELFAKAEEVFDELLFLVEEAAPEDPPDAPSPVPTLEQLLAMLENELKACEKLGAACTRLNIMTNFDWIMAAAGSGSGSGSGQGSGTSMAQAQAQAASAYAKMAAEDARRPKRNGARPGPESGVDEGGNERDRQDWNVLVSKLQKELMQERGTVPPEQYRRAIDAYFRAISEWTTQQRLAP